MSISTLTPTLLTPAIRVALYGRVSSDRQAKEQTIESQLDALKRRISEDGFECDPELCFVEDGFTGESLVRPALDRLRDQAAAGAIDRLYVLCPDRLARKYAYQVLIVEELTRCGVAVIFLDNPLGTNPEQNLLLQVQGIIAEYERAKIMERSRRGKKFAAKRGSISVLSGALMDTGTSARTRGMARHVFKSWLRKRGWFGRFSRGLVRSGVRSERCSGACGNRRCSALPEKRPGTAPRSGPC